MITKVLLRAISGAERCCLI